MDIDVGITLRNDRNEEVTVRIPAGSIIEVASTGYKAQNIAVAKEYVFKLPPNGQRKVIVTGRCLNSKRSVPHLISGRATPFRYAGSSFDQNALWRAVSSPKR